MPNVTVAERMKVYGLDASSMQMPNVTVEARKEFVLKADDPKYRGQVKKLVPKSLDDVKRWIGVSDKAFKRVSKIKEVTLVPIRARYSAVESSNLRKVAHQYVYGSTKSVSAAQISAMKDWFAKLNPGIIVIAVADIHVGAGATLVVDPSVPILFANHITIDPGGKILMRATSSKIDCAGITCL